MPEIAARVTWPGVEKSTPQLSPKVPGVPESKLSWKGLSVSTVGSGFAKTRLPCWETLSTSIALRGFRLARTNVESGNHITPFRRFGGDEAGEFARAGGCR